MLTNKTIIYISANRESEEILSFTGKIVEETGLPIISVTQKPIDLGMNICVGDVGRSGYNIYRQIGIGCKQAKTKYVIWCEADTLYPPEHFAFIPSENDRIYLNKNMWRFYKNHYIKKKNASVAVIISDRVHLLNSINKILRGIPQWTKEEDKLKYRTKGNRKGLKKYGHEYFETEQPVVSIYHENGMHKKLSAVIGPMKRHIKYWPKAKKLGDILSRRA